MDEGLRALLKELHSATSFENIAYHTLMATLEVVTQVQQAPSAPTAAVTGVWPQLIAPFSSPPSRGAVRSAVLHWRPERGYRRLLTVHTDDKTLQDSSVEAISSATLWRFVRRAQEALVLEVGTGVLAPPV